MLMGFHARSRVFVCVGENASVTWRENPSSKVAPALSWLGVGGYTNHALMHTVIEGLEGTYNIPIQQECIVDPNSTLFRNSSAAVGPSSPVKNLMFSH